MGPTHFMDKLGITPEEARHEFLRTTGYTSQVSHIGPFGFGIPRTAYRIETDDHALDYAIDQLVERVYARAKEEARRELQAVQRATLKDITSRIIDEVIQ